jgi:hypothetical protein
MASRKPRADRETIRHALRGSLTDEKRQSVEKGVSHKVKEAVEESIRRNKRALAELADY